MFTIFVRFKILNDKFRMFFSIFTREFTHFTKVVCSIIDKLNNRETFFFTKFKIFLTLSRCHVKDASTFVFSYYFLSVNYCVKCFFILRFGFLYFWQCIKRSLILYSQEL